MSYPQPSKEITSNENAYQNTLSDPIHPTLEASPVELETPVVVQQSNPDLEGLEGKLSESTRMPFIRKVYGILFTQLLVTAMWIGFVSAHREYFMNFFSDHILLLIVAILLELICLYALGCYRSIARSVPTNYILLSIFTLSSSYTISFTTSMYDPSHIFTAAFLTMALVGGLTIYAIFTKTDFSFLFAFIWGMSLVLLAAFIVGIFLKNTFLNLLLSVLVLTILCLFIIFDTQLIIGNNSIEFSIDDYIFAAMMLYLDIMRVFLEILKIIGDK